MDTACETCKYLTGHRCKLWEVKVDAPDDAHCESWQACNPPGTAAGQPTIGPIEVGDRTMTYRDIFGAEAPKPTVHQLYRDVYHAMAGSADAVAALVKAGVVTEPVTLGQLNDAGNRLFAQLHQTERESEAADAERGLDNLERRLGGEDQYYARR